MMVKSINKDSEGNIGSSELLRSYKTILNLFKDDTVKSEIVEGFETILGFKDLLESIDIDNSGNRPFKMWAEYFSENNISSKRKLDDVRKDFEDKKLNLPESLESLLFIYSNPKSPHQDVVRRINLLASIYLYYNTTTESFYWGKAFESYTDGTRVHSLEDEADVWCIAKIIPSDFFPLSLTALNSGKAIQKFCYLFKEDSVSKEDFFDKHLKVAIELQLKEFIEKWSLGDKKSHGTFLKMCRGIIPASFINSFDLKKNLLALVSNQPRTHSLTGVPNVDDLKFSNFKNSYIQEMFGEILDVNVLLPEMKKFGTANNIRVLADKNFVKGFSDLSRDEQKELQRVWVENKYSTDIRISTLNEFYPTDSIVDDVIDFLDRKILPDKYQDSLDFSEISKSFSFSEINKDIIAPEFKEKLRNSLTKRINQISELTVDLTKVLFSTTPKLFDVRQNTLSLLYFLNKEVGLAMPSKINVVFYDSSRQKYCWNDLDQLTYHNTKSSYLFKEIVQISELDCFKNSELVFIDKTNNNVLFEKSKQFEDYLGDVKILPNTTEISFRASDKLVSQTENDVLVEIKNIVKFAFDLTDKK